MRPAVVSRIVTGWRVGQLLAIFFLCPDAQSQKSLQKPTRPSFLSLSKVANGGIELSREFGLLFWPVTKLGKSNQNSKTHSKLY